MTQSPMAGAPDVCQIGAAELTRRFRERELSPVEVTRAILSRAESVQDRFNAFAFIDHEGAMQAARESEARWAEGRPLGPADGVPATIKDLVSVRSWPLRLGSRTTSSAPSVQDAPTAQALRDAGSILVASTTTPEFGWKGVADSPLYGVTTNPWDPARTPGGSSGGAAVAAATGCGVMHLGSDGGGSIRIPASFTGVVGHKPSFGRVPYFPPSAFGTVGHLGPLARSVDDAALMLDVMSRRDIRDWHQNPLAFPKVDSPVARMKWKGVRLGLWTAPPAGAVDAEVLKATSSVAQRLERLGAYIEPVSLPGADLLEIFNIHWFAGAAARVSKIAPERRKELDPGLLRMADTGDRFTAAQFADAAARRASFGIEMDRLLEQYDLLLSPATTIPAFPVGNDVPPGSGQDFWTEWAAFSFPINLSQQPACSVPAGFTPSGLPIGVQFVGPKTGDRLVLEAAAAFLET